MAGTIIIIIIIIIVTVVMLLLYLTEQGDVGGGRCEAGVRTKALDEGRRSRDL